MRARACRAASSAPAPRPTSARFSADAVRAGGEAVLRMARLAGDGLPRRVVEREVEAGQDHARRSAGARRSPSRFGRRRDAAGRTGRDDRVRRRLRAASAAPARGCRWTRRAAGSIWPRSVQDRRPVLARGSRRNSSVICQCSAKASGTRSSRRSSDTSSVWTCRAARASRAASRAADAGIGIVAALR